MQKRQHQVNSFAVVRQVGADNIQLIWPVPANGGSPILGYHVDMEAGEEHVGHRDESGALLA